MLTAGIVGLPNVGKSTLFNAMTRTRKAQMANFPFCTIEPNVAMMEVPDERMYELQKIVKTQVVIPTAIEIMDIAGLVQGASKGEGLGNKFLGNIRNVDAIIHVVRCFDDGDIIHTAGSVDPIRDIEIINTELMLSDMESVEGQIQRNEKKARAKDKDALANIALLERFQAALNEGHPANSVELTEEERERAKSFGLLTIKPVIYACNVSEGDLANGGTNKYVEAVIGYVKQHKDARYCVICGKLESELADLSLAEAQDYLKELGVADSGVAQLIRATYDLLGLASYFTAGEKEVRAWTFIKGMKAPACAGVIHTDFEKGFIKAEVVSYEDLVKYGSYAAAREAGRYRLEGKEYVFQDGDVANFRFNV